MIFNCCLINFNMKGPCISMLRPNSVGLATREITKSIDENDEIVINSAQLATVIQMCNQIEVAYC